MAKRKKIQTLKMRDGQIVIPKRAKITFTAPVKAETFIRVRDEFYANMLRQIQPKHKGADVL